MACGRPLLTAACHIVVVYY
jgi:importin subunit beta-1